MSFDTTLFTVYIYIYTYNQYHQDYILYVIWCECMVPTYLISLHFCSLFRIQLLFMLPVLDFELF